MVWMLKIRTNSDTANDGNTSGDDTNSRRHHHHHHHHQQQQHVDHDKSSNHNDKSNIARTKVIDMKLFQPSLQVIVMMVIAETASTT